MPPMDALRNSLAGNLFSREDEGYGSVKRGRGSTPTDARWPQAIVQAKSVDDVARAIAFSREHDLDLSVRSGGHDMLGASTSAAGLLLDLSLMDQVELDPAAARVRVGGGALAEGLFDIGAPHGLAPVLGMSPDVGIGGLILGGGIGWISGQFGAAVDHVVAIDVVTADGRAISASVHENPDLFWAMRGGGGNFGVATAFTLRMVPLREVVTASITYRAADPAFLLTSVAEILLEAGDPLDLDLSFTLGSDPHASVTLCWCGDRVAGERVAGRLSRIAGTVSHGTVMQPLAAFVGSQADGQPMFLRGGELDHLGPPTVEAIAEVVGRGGPDGCSVGLLHYMHGELCRVPINATSFVRPKGHLLYNIVASTSDCAVEPAGIAWACATWESLRSVSSPRTYPNYLCNQDEGSIRAAFEPHYERLRVIKRAYDPDNVFHGNRNIRP